MSKVSAGDYTFHPVLVAPFYLQFMNANVLSMPEDERGRLAAKFRETLPLYSDRDLRYMLRWSWRPAKVAAWVIATRGDRTFIPDLADHLANHVYVEHICIALAALGGATAAEPLQVYLGSVLPPTGNSDPWEECISPDWALAALEHIDAPSARSWLEPAGPWERFLTVCDPRLADPWKSRLEEAGEAIPRVMTFIHEELRVRTREGVT